MSLSTPCPPPASLLLVQTISQPGFGAVTLSGIELAMIDGLLAGADLYVSGTRYDDVITYTPTSASAGTFSAEGIHPVFAFINVPQDTNTFAIDGGSGGLADTVIVNGSGAKDLIRVNAATREVQVVRQAVSSPIEWRDVLLDSGTPLGDVGAIECVVARGNAGVDTFHVVPADAVGDGLFITVDGGPGATSDALVITDLNGSNTPVPLAATDFVVDAKSRTEDAGTILVYRDEERTPDIVYEDVEIVSLNVDTDDATGSANALVLGPDEYEENEHRSMSAYLGSGETLNVTNLAISPIASEYVGIPADEDWFRVVARDTGTLDVQVYYDLFGGLLPEAGTLVVELYDSGTTLNLIASSDTTDLWFGATGVAGDSRVRIPVVAGQTYYIHVVGANDDVVNGYDMTIVNEAPPVPENLELVDTIASTTVDTGTSTTVFRGSAGLNDTNDYYNGKYVYFTSGALNGLRALVTDYVGATHQFTVAAGALTSIPAIGDAFIVESIDTGRSQLDNVTRDNTPTLVLRLDDGIFLHDLPGNAEDDTPPAGVIDIPFQTALGALPAALDTGYAIAIFDEGSYTQPGTPPQVPLGFATMTTEEGVYIFTTPVLADGSHFLTARVVMIDPADPNAWGYGDRSLALEIVVDTLDPPGYFGLPALAADGLDASSDTGVIGEPTVPVDTFTDRVTSDTTPTFFGTAEADAIVRLYVDTNGNGTLDGADRLIAETVATPVDGTNQDPTGRWTATSNVNLNDSSLGLGVDGTRRIFVTAEDVAGNVSDPQTLLIFVDTAGPQVTAVQITGEPGYNLFGLKPGNAPQGPTPLVYSLTIDVQDLPDRDTVNFPQHFALALVTAMEQGNYELRGDANGVIAIQSVNVVNHPLVNGEAATATIVLTFAEPLPDDRFTLRIKDSLVDPANNRLDGESDAIEPEDTPDFPTGDGVPGGDFVARFTVDSRPEIGTWAAGSAYVDINGNFSYDPDNLDAVNRDFAYIMGYTSDDVFCGNFAADPGDDADGFDKLAVYGKDTTYRYRWIIDTDNDGVGDIKQYDPAEVNGLPVSGNFDRNADNGDEVGVFDGEVWHLDTDHDFMVYQDIEVATALRGYPITGDFDGDGYTDLATYKKGYFYFDLTNDDENSWDGAVNDTFRVPFLSFIGTNERPVAADMNQDGITDIGLWVPDRSGVGDNLGEWYFFISDEPAGNAVNYGTVNAIREEFSIDPLGNDLFAQFGDEFALPIVGNFDPPVSGESAAPDTLDLVGTSGDDVLTVAPGTEDGTWTVELNGTIYALAGDSVSLTFDGLGGTDKVSITGGNEGGARAELGPESVSVVGPAYSFQIDDAEKVGVTLSGADNSAVFHGTAVSDAFTADPASASLKGGGISLSVQGAGSVTVEGGTGGRDSADLTGSSGQDTFVGTLGESTLQGDGFSIVVRGFYSVSASALTGAGDSATLRGTDGTDSLAVASSIGTLQGAQYLIHVKNFDAVRAFGESGDDSVLLIGSTGSDSLLATPTSARLVGSGVDVDETGFERLRVYSNGGPDTAKIYDSSGNDTLTASHSQARLFGVGYDIRLWQFRYLNAYASTGSDTAIFTDSPGNDTFTSTPDYSKLWGSNYLVLAKLFDVSMVSALSGGVDTANLYGAADKSDVANCTSTVCFLAGSGYSSRAERFEVVNVFGLGGGDKAVLHDAVLGGPFTDASTATVPNSYRYVHWLNQFAEIQLKRRGITVQTVHAVDKVFAACW